MAAGNTDLNENRSIDTDQKHISVAENNSMPRERSFVQRLKLRENLPGTA